MSDDLYEELGVAQDATTAEIKKAYKKKAQKTHPDRGGDEVAFQHLTAAKDVLCDPDKRKQYDRTGSVRQHTVEDEAIQILAQLFGRVVEELSRNKFRHGIDIVDEIAENEHEALSAQITKFEAAITLTESLTDRIQRPGKDDLYKGVIKQRIESIRHQIEDTERKITIFKLVQEMAHEYMYDDPEPPTAPAPPTATFTIHT